MSDFVNTIDLLGDDVVLDGIIGRTITQFHDNVVTNIRTNMFIYCVNLESVIIPNVVEIGSQGFDSCSKLKTIDTSSLTFFYAVQYCSALDTFILRSSSMCVVANTNAFLNTKIASGAGYIYVPRALIDSYKVANNWSKYANQFRALEDYTVDGTITGELDESKI